MRTILTFVAISFFTNFVYCQSFDIEYTVDNSLESVSIYYLFQDSITKRSDSALYERRNYKQGFLIASEIFGQFRSTTLTEYHYSHYSKMLNRSISRIKYNGQDSALKVVTYHYDDEDHKIFSLDYDSSSSGIFVHYEFYKEKYNEFGQIEFQNLIYTNGPTYNSSTTAYQYDKHGKVLQRLIYNSWSDEDTSVFYYFHKYDSNNKLISTEAMSIRNIYDYQNGTRTLLNRDTTKYDETKYDYNNQGQKIQEIYYIEIPDHWPKNVGQTFSKKIKEYYYFPDGQLEFLKYLLKSDKFGKEKTTEYRAYFNYRKQ